MSKELNIGFTILAPHPIDTRLRVSTYSGLANIAIPYEGLTTYVEDEDKDYRYISGSWVLFMSTSDFVADSASSVGVTYTQAEVQAIITELRAVKTALKNAGIMKTS
jgi:hypothetical protein